ncbi:MAG TPA: hypothetical protein VG890_17070 [Puia sp.]|nr:hypothetical protein [Puia sp.]
MKGKFIGIQIRVVCAANRRARKRKLDRLFNTLTTKTARPECQGLFLPA